MSGLSVAALSTGETVSGSEKYANPLGPGFFSGLLGSCCTPSYAPGPSRLNWRV